jgi:tetratricopeptide (TPR) repeat protein
MKTILNFLMLIILCNGAWAQSTYESPLGFSLSFDDTWKRLPKEVLYQKIQAVESLLDYKKEVQFDACYQKIGNADMDYPYILLKNIYATTNDEEEIKKVQESFTSKSQFEDAIQNLVNGKMGVELQIGKNYYDAANKILVFTYDIGLSIKGDLVGLFAFYFGKNASLMIYCYSYKDEFKYDQKEFMEVIYSVKDKGMKTSIDDYTTKHDAAVLYYNEGLRQAALGNRPEAIKSYTLAIQNYPIEDSYAKSEAYYNRGVNKRQLDDLRGAIADYTEAIRLRPDYYKAYNNRGFAKMMLEDYTGAIADFTSTIKFDNYNSELSNVALGNRGLAKLNLGQDGCLDLKKAIELGNKQVVDTYHQLCN